MQTVSRTSAQPIVYDWTSSTIDLTDPDQADLDFDNDGLTALEEEENDSNPFGEWAYQELSLPATFAEAVSGVVVNRALVPADYKVTLVKVNSQGDLLFQAATTGSYYVRQNVGLIWQRATDRWFPVTNELALHERQKVFVYDFNAKLTVAALGKFDDGEVKGMLWSPDDGGEPFVLPDAQGTPAVPGLISDLDDIAGQSPQAFAIVDGALVDLEAFQIRHGDNYNMGGALEWHAVNNLGEFFGRYFWIGSYPEYVLHNRDWTFGTNIWPYSESEAGFLNDYGEFAGTESVSVGAPAPRPFYYDGEKHVFPNNYGYTAGLSNSGTVLVEHTPYDFTDTRKWFLWRPGGQIEIRNLIASDLSSVEEFQKVKVGAQDQLAGHALKIDGTQVVFILTPDQDADNDGIPNDWEIYYGLNAYNNSDAYDDIDNDGFNNRIEYLLSLDPNANDSSSNLAPNIEIVDGIDTDGDGIPDTWEEFHGLDRLNAADASLDYDRDGYTNFQEFQFDTDPVGAPSYRVVEEADYYGLEPGDELLAIGSSGEAVIAREIDGSTFQMYRPHGTAEFQFYGAGEPVDDTLAQLFLDGNGELGGYVIVAHRTATDEPWSISTFVTLNSGIPARAFTEQFSKISRPSRHPFAGMVCFGGRLDGESVDSYWELTSGNILSRLPIPAGYKASAWQSPTYADNGDLFMTIQPASGWIRRAVCWPQSDRDTPELLGQLSATRPTTARGVASNGSARVFLGESWAQVAGGWGLRLAAQSGTTVSDLGSLGGRNSSIAAVRGSWAVGYSDILPAEGSVLTRQAMLARFDDAGNVLMEGLPTADNVKSSQATGLNNAGEIIGTESQPNYGQLPVMWRHGQRYELQSLLGSAINDYSIQHTARIGDDGVIHTTGYADGSYVTRLLVPDVDVDGDGLPDAWEIAQGLDPYRAGDESGDLDNDGLWNLQEYQIGSNPNNGDTDADDLPDGWEYEWGFDLRDPSNRDDDPDKDYLSNYREYLNGSNPTGYFQLHTYTPEDAGGRTSIVDVANTGQILLRQYISWQDQRYSVLQAQEGPDNDVSYDPQPLTPLNQALAGYTNITITSLDANGWVYGSARNANGQYLIFKSDVSVDAGESAVVEIPLSIDVTGQFLRLKDVCDNGRYLLIQSSGSNYVHDMELETTISVAPDELPESFEGDASHWLYGNAEKIDESGTVLYNRSFQNPQTDQFNTETGLLKLDGTYVTPDFDDKSALDQWFEMWPTAIGSIDGVATIAFELDAPSDSGSHLSDDTGARMAMTAPDPHYFSVPDFNDAGDFLINSHQAAYLKVGQSAMRIDALQCLTSASQPLYAAQTLPGIFVGAKNINVSTISDTGTILGAGTITGTLKNADGQLVIYQLTPNNDRDGNGLSDDWQVFYGVTGGANDDENGDGTSNGDKMVGGENPTGGGGGNEDGDDDGDPPPPQSLPKVASQQYRVVSTSIHPDEGGGQSMLQGFAGYETHPDFSIYYGVGLGVAVLTGNEPNITWEASEVYDDLVENLAAWPDDESYSPVPQWADFGTKLFPTLAGITPSPSVLFSDEASPDGDWPVTELFHYRNHHVSPSGIVRIGVHETLSGVGEAFKTQLRITLDKPAEDGGFQYKRTWLHVRIQLETWHPFEVPVDPVLLGVVTATYDVQEGETLSAPATFSLSEAGHIALEDGGLTLRSGSIPLQRADYLLPVEVKGINTAKNPEVHDDLYSGVDKTSSMPQFEGMTGYQDKDWILAPIAGGNKVEMISGAAAGLVVTFEGDEIRTNPGFVVKSPATVQFNGFGNTTSDTTLKMGIGGGSPVEVPLGVKSMKLRHLSVTIHPVTYIDPYHGQDVLVKNLPTDQEIEDYFSEVFGTQLNLKFTIVRRPPRRILWDTLNADDFPFPFGPLGAGSDIQALLEARPGDRRVNFNSVSIPGKERNAISDALSSSSIGDIQVFVIAHAEMFRTLVRDGGRMRVDFTANAFAHIPSRVAWMADCSVDESDKEAYLNILAHEIGHIITNAGHPDEGKGPAPLDPDYIDHRFRLMASGSLRNKDRTGVQLVKAEWDRAEQQLSEIKEETSEN